MLSLLHPHFCQANRNEVPFPICEGNNQPILCAKAQHDISLFLDSSVRARDGNFRPPLHLRANNRSLAIADRLHTVLGGVLYTGSFLINLQPALLVGE